MMDEWQLLQQLPPQMRDAIKASNALSSGSSLSPGDVAPPLPTYRPSSKLKPEHDGKLSAEAIRTMLTERRITPDDARIYYVRNPQIAKDVIQGNPDKGLAEGALQDRAIDAVGSALKNLPERTDPNMEMTGEYPDIRPTLSAETGAGGYTNVDEMRRLVNEGRIPQSELDAYLEANPKLAEGVITGNPDKGMEAGGWLTNFDDRVRDLIRSKGMEAGEGLINYGDRVRDRIGSLGQFTDPRDLEEQAGVVTTQGAGLDRNPYARDPAGLGRNPYGDTYGTETPDLQEQIADSVMTALEAEDDARPSLGDPISGPTSRGAAVDTIPGAGLPVNDEPVRTGEPQEAESRWDRARSGLRNMLGFDDDDDLSSLKMALIAAGGGLAGGANWSEGLGNAMAAGSRTYLAAESADREADSRDEALQMRRDQNTFDNSLANQKMALEHRRFQLAQAAATATDPLAAAKLQLEMRKLEAEIANLDSIFGGIGGDIESRLKAWERLSKEGKMAPDEAEAILDRFLKLGDSDPLADIAGGG